MINITNQQMIPFTITPSDLQGNPATVESVAWSAIHATGGSLAGVRMLAAADAPALFGTLELPTDGRATILYPDDGVEVPSLFAKVEADVDLGQGVELITAQEEVAISGPRATNLGLASGNPVPKEPVS